MYYEEQVQNGVLCYRSSPNGEWIQMSAERLTAILLELRQRHVSVAPAPMPYQIPLPQPARASLDGARPPIKVRSNAGLGGYHPEREDMSDPLRNLPPTLIAENGSGFGFVCIWRKGESGDSARKCTVGEWLSKPENQRGTWLIDGGWGGPPGPIHVRWSEPDQAWENGGYCGDGFSA